MGSLGIRSRWDQDGVAGPPAVNLVEGGVVLGDDDHLLLTLLPCDADEPVIQEGEIGLADGANNDGAVASGEGRSASERVVLPPGYGSVACVARGGGGGGEEGDHGTGQWEEDAKEEEKGEDGDKAGSTWEEGGHGALRLSVERGAGGEWVGFGRRRQRLLPLMERHEEPRSADGSIPSATADEWGGTAKQSAW